MKQCFRSRTTAFMIEAFDKVKYLTVDEQVYILQKVENHENYSKNLMKFQC